MEMKRTYGKFLVRQASGNPSGVSLMLSVGRFHTCGQCRNGFRNHQTRPIALEGGSAIGGMSIYPSIRPSVRPSVRHKLVLTQN